MNKTSIGDVHVVLGEPPGGNPYRARDEYTIGKKREQALRAFRDGTDPELVATLTFWHAPVSGGARRITDPAQVDWSGMGR